MNRTMTSQRGRLLRYVILGASALVLTACEIEPKPLLETEIDQSATQRLADVSANQEPITAEISLYEAMARAVKYNLDYKLEVLRMAVADGELDVSEYDLLPQLVASAEYTGRNNVPGGSSRAILTGIQSLQPSQSVDQNRVTADLTLSWDILDFGLSYVRSKQLSNSVLIAEENKRAAINRIIGDVRTAYWRTVSAQRLTDRTLKLEAEVKAALAGAKTLAKRRRISPLPALTYRRELHEIQNTLQEIKIDFAASKAQLAALMNVTPGQDFRVVDTFNPAGFQKFALNRAEVVDIAMRNRPELRTLTYEQRNNILQADAELLRVFPNLRGFLGLNYDSNSFLLNNNWIGWGARVSWNLLQVLNYPERERLVQMQGEVLDVRALATTMAVATQVDVALTQYNATADLLSNRVDFNNVQRQINKQIRAGTRAGRISEQTRLREELNTIVNEILLDRAYSDFETAFANIYSSTGLDPFQQGATGNEPVAVLAETMRELWQARRSSILTN